MSEPKSSRTTAAKHASIASFHLVESFLLSLVDAKDDGRILISLEDNNTITLRYMLLNPAERFKEVIDQARSVILAGGTMEPISDFLRQLFPAIPEEKITTLSCRHVIPKENLLTQVVTVGPRKVDFEFKFSTRGDEAIVRRFLKEVNRLMNS
jgi:chromosome transmission fidelity protein 1